MRAAVEVRSNGSKTVCNIEWKYSKGIERWRCDCNDHCVLAKQ